MTRESMIKVLRYKAEHIKTRIKPEFFSEVADTLEKEQHSLNKLMKELEEIFSDIREKNVDDSVCGLCEYDCDHGLDGYANECPGFEKDDCFKLKEEYRNEWINKIVGEVTE